MKKTSYKLALICGLVLAGCSTSPQGRKHITAPLPVSTAYSEADMRIKLATSSKVAAPCAGIECTRNQAFDAQVQSLGSRLALTAFDHYPDLIKRVSTFEFEVAEKSEPGTASTASGKIVIFRGVQELGFDEAGVAFLLAREMGHVIGEHHDENSATRILLSIAAGVLFPALNLFGGSTAVAQQATQASSMTTLTTAAASTAASYVGSQAILAGVKPDQLSEADLIALGLLETEGWHLHDVTGSMNQAERITQGGSWVEDLRVSIVHLQKLDEQEQSTDLSLRSGDIILSSGRECRAEPEWVAEQEPLESVPSTDEIVAAEPEIVPEETIQPELLAEATEDQAAPAVSEQTVTVAPLTPEPQVVAPPLPELKLQDAPVRLNRDAPPALVRYRKSVATVRPPRHDKVRNAPGVKTGKVDKPVRNAGALPPGKMTKAGGRAAGPVKSAAGPKPVQVHADTRGGKAAEKSGKANKVKVRPKDKAAKPGMAAVPKQKATPKPTPKPTH